MPEELLSRVVAEADQRVQYGAWPQQFGDLRVPELGEGERAPVVMFLHGGWWKARYGLEYGGHLCAALKADGIATWSIEYRRVGDAGGGWPGTFEDAAAGYDFLATLAKSYALDLGRIVVVGHSAGGHLAFWLAGRTRIAVESPLRVLQPVLPMRAVIGLAGAVDLRLVIELAGKGRFTHTRDEVVRLMGGTPTEVPERYGAGNPGELVPLGVPQILLQGSRDDQIPKRLAVEWARRGRGLGDRVEVMRIAGADHYDVVDPESKAWKRVRLAILRAVGGEQEDVVRVR